MGHTTFINSSGGKVASDSFTDKIDIMLNKVRLINCVLQKKNNDKKHKKKQLLIKLVYDYTKLIKRHCEQV